MENNLKCKSLPIQAKRGLGLQKKMPISSNLYKNMGHKNGPPSQKICQVEINLFRKNRQAVQRALA